MMLEHNMFVERVLPGSVLRNLTDDEMAEYRRPFCRPRGPPPDADLAAPDPDRGRTGRCGADRGRLFAWMARVRHAQAVRQCRAGRILTGGPREFCRGWPNQTEVTVPGLHFLQEDSGP